MNEEALALFINATFMRFNLLIAGAVVSITVLIVIYVMFTVLLPEDK